MAYATVDDVRASGVTPAMATDDQIENFLDEVTGLIDHYTAQFFEPRPGAYLFDGHDHHILQVGIAAIEVTEIVVLNDQFSTSPQDESINLQDVTVYNRDNRLGQIATQDSGAPRLITVFDNFFFFARAGSVVWPGGTQNVRITGTWGRTEPRAAYLDTGVEPFVLAVDDDLQLLVNTESVEVEDIQTVVFAAGTFPDFNAVTATQLSAALNASVTGLSAARRSTTPGVVSRLRSSLVAHTSRVTVVGGLASPKLGLDVAVEQFWPQGAVPREITRAAVRMVRTALGLGNPGAGGGGSSGIVGAVKRRRTRSQEVEVATGGDSVNQHLQFGGITGDPVVDQILTRFRRPARVAVLQGHRRALPFR